MRAPVSVLAPSCPTHAKAQPMGLQRNALLSSRTCSQSAAVHPEAGAASSTSEGSGQMSGKMPACTGRVPSLPCLRCSGTAVCQEVAPHCTLLGLPAPGPQHPTVPSCSGCGSWRRALTRANLHPSSGKALISHK